MPEGDSFLDKIKKLKLYPITSLRYLPKTYKKIFLNNNIILARDVISNAHRLLDYGMNQNDINIVIKEIELLTSRKSWK
jgi:hypothetical protein